jgi:hypothetical protein
LKLLQLQLLLQLPTLQLPPLLLLMLLLLLPLLLPLLLMLPLLLRPLHRLLLQRSNQLDLIESRPMGRFFFALHEDSPQVEQGLGRLLIAMRDNRPRTSSDICSAPRQLRTARRRT